MILGFTSGDYAMDDSMVLGYAIVIIGSMILRTCNS